MNVIEWTIKNFSYWNGYVHDKKIECPGSDFTNCPGILLYPRGLSGSEEHLVVHLYGKAEVSTVLSGHLSYIDSSGSLICTQEINETEKRGDFYELISKLKFTEVVAIIRKNVILHQDRFFLRCEFKWGDNRAYRLYTTIDVLDSSVKVDLNTIKEMREWISTIQYPLDDLSTRFLKVMKVDTTFTIQPILLEKNVSVSTYLSILNSDSVIRTEDKEHVFKDNTIWTFLNSLTKELTKEGLTLLLRVKIVPSNKYRHNGYYTPNQKFLDLLPTHIFTDTSSVPGNLSTKRLKASNERENSVTVLLTELMCLYKDHDFADFQLRCDEVSIPTHKSILSARSPVFKAMLLSDMREAESDSMDVVDLDINTLGRFLVFLYTGTVDDLEWEVALKLYYAADKYQVPSLKRECFSVFRKQVSISNVCDILSLADRHQDEDLTKETHSFILHKYNDVLKSEGWETFMNNEPMLALKTLTYFAKENKFKVIPNS